MVTLVLATEVAGPHLFHRSIIMSGSLIIGTRVCRRWPGQCIAPPCCRFTISLDPRRGDGNTNNLTPWCSWFSLFNYDSSCKRTLRTDSDIGMMERDGFGLVAGSAGLGRDVCLARWLDHKWASEQENVGSDSEGETIRRVPENPSSPSLTKRRGARRCPHIYMGCN